MIAGAAAEHHGHGQRNTVALVGEDLQCGARGGGPAERRQPSSATRGAGDVAGPDRRRQGDELAPGLSATAEVDRMVPGISAGTPTRAWPGPASDL